ncbi:MAG: ABC transporter substrate-binding protein [Eubacteriales bacterium]|nr:ABC transporter substrate-binding protein [Eubacteriales bacterium]
MKPKTILARITVLTLLLSVILLAGCSQPGKAMPQADQIRVACMKGPTGIGLVHLMDQNEQGQAQNPYVFSIHGSADEITPKLINGELDLAAVPANLASVIYNNTQGQVEVLAINTLGVNYLVETGTTVKSLDDLRGKTIVASGKGSSPEFALRYLLQENGIDPDQDVTLEWKSEATEVVALLAQTPGMVAMLPQPYVAVAQGKVPGLNVAIDLNAVWKDLDNGSLMITGVLVGRKAFVDQYEAQVETFLEEYQSSTRLANESIPKTAQLTEKYGIVAAAAAEKAIPQCNITYLAGADMKTALSGYLEVLMAQNAKSIGGQLPDDAFYFQP